ncbi:retrovirus-related pol polyprotein from transposon TNT 1-94 [Tanacetum coccineum]
MNNFLDRKMNVLILVLLSTIVISLKALNESFSIKNYVRKFLRSLHPKWIAKVIAIEETKYLPSLSLDELIGNLKESSDDKTWMSESEDEEYAMVVMDFKKFFRRRGRFVRKLHDDKKPFQKYRYDRKGKSERKCFRCGDPKHLIGECPKLRRHNEQKAFVGGSWSNSNEENEEKTNDEMCHMAQSSNTVHSNSSYYSDDNSSIDDDTLQNEYNKISDGSHKDKDNFLKDKETVASSAAEDKTVSNLNHNFTSKLKQLVINKVTMLIATEKEVKQIYKPLLKPELGFANKDHSPPPFKTSPLEDDDLVEEEAINIQKKNDLGNNIERETLEIDNVVNIKDSKNHPLDNVIRNLNQITLKSQAKDKSNFFGFVSTIEHKNVDEAIKDESWLVVMQEELNQFTANKVWDLVPPP